jgi:hypothetical protein
MLLVGNASGVFINIFLGGGERGAEIGDVIIVGEIILSSPFVKTSE